MAGLANKTSQTKIHFTPAISNSPPDRGTPPSNEGTGSRGDCLTTQNTLPLTTLVGSPNLKLTVKEHPTFWIYIPYTQKEANEGEFSLQDGDAEILRTRFKLPSTPGIISMTLPSTASPLVIGKEYRWYLDINCSSPRSSSESPTPASLTGLVQRVSISSQLQQELNAAKTPLEKISTYAENGIWIEALTELAQLRLREPQNLQLRNIWVELLSAKDVGLAKIAQEPILGLMTITNSFIE
ncbi:DUF928 domain-containing protein [Nostoc sp. TCL26-01]|uniref:DUF928 domain-containing protein n=1 Tax=Nostoc sp. TCL26-01 TaxID=2576904 RepID=UPI0021196E92|nr:DUF928 domain-containing protein [Nostoc sp. TCL26-01]